ncbi:MAG: hypothetical protein RL518_1457 [Pseudomonadota bacterium]
MYGLLSLGFAIVVGYLAWRYAHTSCVVSVLIGVNASAFICMGLDKSFARSHALRIPEALLLVLALCGGSGGILLGVRVFKHKTRKASFQFVLLIVFAAQLGLMQFLGVEAR